MPLGALRRHSNAARAAYPCLRQKAPSAKRYIKTVKEALAAVFGLGVRKHRAPNGALRPRLNILTRVVDTSLKAPSATRCIKTKYRSSYTASQTLRQKAPNATRCIKTSKELRHWPVRTSCQKAPSATRCIKTCRWRTR